MKPFVALDSPLSGVVLVEASAGTGKTYAISTLFVRHLLETEITVDQILVVTFTEAATAELRDRIRRRLKEAIEVCEAVASSSVTADHDPTLVTLVRRQPHTQLARRTLLEAVLHFDSASIFTIHGFCQRVLRENAFATRVPFEAELLQDTRPLVDELLTDFWLGTLRDAPLSLVHQLDSTQFTPTQRDLQTFAYFVAQIGDLKVVPPAAHKLSVLDEARARSAHEQAKGAFRTEELRQLLPKQHLDSRLRKLTEYFEHPFGTAKLPEPAKYLFQSTLAQRTTRGSAPTHPFFSALEELASVTTQYDEAVAEHVLKLKQDLVTFLQRAMSRRKLERGQLSFDDLLQQLYHALVGNEGQRLATSLRGKYHAALVDEFQDTDPIQYGIFASIFMRAADYGPQSLFLIGDPKQAIYSFRGADVFAYMQAVNDVEASRRFTMATNYRSDEQLVCAVNALFSRHLRPFLFQGLDYPRVTAKQSGASSLQGLPGSALEFHFVKRPEGMANPYSRTELDRLMPQRVAAQIHSMLESSATIADRTLAPKDIAVLTRTNREAFDCQRELARLGIPCVVQGDRSVFEQPEAQQLQLVLAAAAEPSGASNIRTALATELLGQSATSLEALDADEGRWDFWVERFRGYSERWRNEGFIQMIRQLLLECGVTQRLLNASNGERSMTNVLHLVELLHTQAMSEHLGPSGLIQYLAEQRNRGITPTESEQVRLESDEDAVVLTTIHKSKGLEYPIVICPFLGGSALPWSRSKHWVEFHEPDTRQHTLDLGSDSFDSHASVKSDESLSEGLRLLYVALTRAQHRCLVYWGALGPGFHESALAYLLYGGESGSQVSNAKKADDASLMAPLLELEQQQQGFELITEPALDETGLPLDTPFAKRSTSAPDSSSALSARRVHTMLSHWSRIASFTELTRNAPSTSAVPPPASDHDELADPPYTVVDSTLPTHVSPKTVTTLSEFPGGATTGNFFHHVLENIDFTQAIESAVVRQALVSHGLDAALDELAKKGVLETLQTPLHDNLSLSMIAPSQRLNELEFTFPVGNTSSDTQLTSAALAQVFRDIPSQTVTADYANHVERLPFAALQGYLRGFIDLVFEHEGQWYLVDYKTNNLGVSYANYSPSVLHESMKTSHYVLQYHVYTLALHRYLTLRLSGYNYTSHFGGVYYLFMRGMSPELGTRTGVFFEKPPFERLQRLSDVFQGTTGEPC